MKREGGGMQLDANERGERRSMTGSTIYKPKRGRERRRRQFTGKKVGALSRDRREKPIVGKTQSGSEQDD